MSECAHETLDVEFGSLFNYRPQEPCKALFYGRVLTINSQQRTISHPTYQHPRFPLCPFRRCPRREGLEELEYIRNSSKYSVGNLRIGKRSNTSKPRCDEKEIKAGIA